MPVTETAPEIDSRLRKAYGGLLRRLFAWWFSPVQAPADAGERLRALAAEGVVVHVGRSSAVVTFAFFQHLFLRLGAPLADAVEGLGVKVWQPWGRLFLGRRHVRAPLGENVTDAVTAGSSALVFLRQSGSLVGSVLAKRDPFPALVAAQRTMDRPIFLVPQLLIWPRAPQQLQKNIFDVLFGEPEAPGFWRSAFSLAWNRRKAFVRMGDPINLAEAIRSFEGLDDKQIARRVRGALYHHLARETRTVVGPPQKTSERLIVEVMRDRTLRGVLAQESRARGRADDSVEREARKALKEIAACYSERAVGLAKIALDWLFGRIYDGVEVDDKSLDKVVRASARGPIAICPSHKSHIDYLVMSYVFYTRGLIVPHIAAGINLAFFPLGLVFRRLGAYFIRRSFKGDQVYAAVLRAYVRKLVADGWTQEFFVEGGRSRSGKVLLPKFGILTMQVDAWIDGVRPDFAFIPSWVGYAKIIEAKSYAHELSGGEKKPEDLGALLRAPKVLTSRYGRVYIRFGDPLWLAELAEARGFDRENHTPEEKRALVRTLGFRIVAGINGVSGLTATALLSSALLSHDRRGLTTAELVDRMRFLLGLVREAGGEIVFPLESEEALDPRVDGPMKEARIAHEKDGVIEVHEVDGKHIFQVAETQRVTLDYHKNTAIHFFAPDALFATALLTAPTRDRTSVRERTRELSRLLKQEFIYQSAPFEELFDDEVRKGIRRGYVEERDGQLHPTADGEARLRLLADLIVQFIEAYVSANDALHLLERGPLDRREFFKAALARARASYLADQVRRLESLSKATLENAMALFESEHVVERTGDKGRQIALGKACPDAEAIKARLEQMRSFLIEKSA